MFLPSRSNLFDISVFKISQLEKSQLENGKRLSFIHNKDHVYHVYCYTCNKKLVTKSGVTGILNEYDKPGISLKLLNEWIIVPYVMVTGAFSFLSARDVQKELDYIARFNSYMKKDALNSKRIPAKNVTNRLDFTKTIAKKDGLLNPLRNITIEDVRSVIFKGMNMKTNVISGYAYSHLMKLSNKPDWMKTICSKSKNNRHLLQVSKQFLVSCKTCCCWTKILKVGHVD